MNTDVCLNLKRVSFFCSYDEGALFHWLRKMRSVVDVVGVHDEIHVYVDPAKIDWEEILNLIGLWFRYKIRNPEQLAQFTEYLNKEEQGYFTQKDTYWHKKIFTKL